METVRTEGTTEERRPGGAWLQKKLQIIICTFFLFQETRRSLAAIFIHQQSFAEKISSKNIFLAQCNMKAVKLQQEKVLENWHQEKKQENSMDAKSKVSSKVPIKEKCGGQMFTASEGIKRNSPRLTWALRKTSWWV